MPNYYLFIDTSEVLKVGLLNEKLAWVSFKETGEKKTSSIVHKVIYEVLKDQQINFMDLGGLFFLAGPGSYTGIRVSEGIAGICTWQQLPVFSFHHFEVPQLLGHKAYIWYKNAFKGEFFAYKWDGVSCSHELIKDDALEFYLDNGVNNNYSLFTSVDTSKEIIKSSEKLFKVVLKDKLLRAPYYYRTLEQEFHR
ncbi:MAG: hypothetical protein ISR65_06345 [Bacteriovoracaceae bacterium]|nr:hypothetical protein [Bacteriovoracaceae bacterium]